MTDLDIRPTETGVLTPVEPTEELIGPTLPVPLDGPDLAPATTGGPPDAGQRFAPRNPHDRRLRGWRGVLVALIVLLALALLGWAVATVLLSSPLQASGEVQADQSAQLNLSTTGSIAAIEVVPGQRVKAGQLLAREADTSLMAKLTADQAKLTADQAALTQLKSGPTAAARQEFQTAVTEAGVAASAAEAKLAQTEQTTAAAVTSAETQVKADQALLAVDQQNYENDIPECTGASPPVNCATDQRQVQVDESTLATDETQLQSAVANQQAEISAAQSGVAQASAAVASAQAAQAVGTQAPTAQQLSAAEALIQQDQSTITSDKQAIAQTELTAPFAGVVASVGGTVGDIDTTGGVRQAASAAPVTSQSSTGINLFPQSPQQSSSPTPSVAPLVELDSLQTRIVIEVPETAVSQVHVGQVADASMPAFGNTTFKVSVSQILPSTVSQNGSVYVLVDLTAKASAIQRIERAASKAKSGGQLAGFTVNVSF
jgi:multidrug efflux pump subunit AcrA (membrane-fusion protein)